MKYLFNLFFLMTVTFGVSCASKDQAPGTLSLLESELPKELNLKSSGLEVIQYRTLKVVNEKEGRSLVENKRSFLIDLFKQSEDPYFGTPRWPADCLKRNQIGGLKSRDRDLSFSAQLTVDKRWNAGDCTENGKDAVLKVSYCANQSQVVVIFLTGLKAREAELHCAVPIRLSF